jgi:hypothetical protein
MTKALSFSASPRVNFLELPHQTPPIFFILANPSDRFVCSSETFRKMRLFGRKKKEPEGPSLGETNDNMDKRCEVL